MLSGEIEVQRWEKACPKSSSSSVAELDKELRSLLNWFPSLILQECCLPLGTAAPGINFWGFEDLTGLCADLQGNASVTYTQFITNFFSFWELFLYLCSERSGQSLPTARGGLDLIL